MKALQKWATAADAKLDISVAKKDHHAATSEVLYAEEFLKRCKPYLTNAISPGKKVKVAKATSPAKKGKPAKGPSPAKKAKSVSGRSPTTKAGKGGKAMKRK